MEDRNNHKDRAHAVFSPSSMARIITCPGSVILSEGIEQKVSEYAEEGTKAHEAAEFAVKAFLKGCTVEWCGAESEMTEYADQYARFIKDKVDKFKPDKVYVEEKVMFSDLIWGTADFLAVKDRGDSYDLLFVDYKYGKGIEVNPEGNEQLLTYVTAAVSNLDKPLRKAFTYIYQPRVGSEPYQRAVYGKAQIDAWRDQLVALEKLYPKVKKNPEKYINAKGISHCRFCPVKPTCKAFLDESRKNILVNIGEEPKIPDVNSLDIKTRVKIMRYKKDIENYLKDVEHSLLADAMSGQELPGWKVVSGRSQRRFIDDEKKVVATLKELGVKDPYKKTLIGIGDAEKLIPGSKREVGEKISPIVTKPPGKLQLAPEDDKRVAVAFTDRQELINNMDDE